MTGAGRDWDAYGHAPLGSDAGWRHAGDYVPTARSAQTGGRRSAQRTCSSPSTSREARNNKALEIYNGTGAPVVLDAGSYSIQMFFNGSSLGGPASINLAGTLANGDVFVYAQASATAVILAQADADQRVLAGSTATTPSSSATAPTVIDAIGQVGVDPGTEWGTGLTSTADNTLRRKANVCAGDPNGADAFDPASEWDGFAIDTFDGLGSHTANCGGGGTPNLSVTDVSHNEGNSGTSTYSFAVNLSSAAGAGGVTFDVATADDSATVADNDYVGEVADRPDDPVGPIELLV